MVEKDLFAWEVKKDGVFEGFVYAYDRVGARLKLSAVVKFRKDKVGDYTLGDKVVKVNKVRRVGGTRVVNGNVLRK